MPDQDYVLGTHDAEIERLGLQHRVWRARVLDAWRRAGINVGQTVLDVGAGPGYASIDLAEIVGSRGQVIAVDRSQRFLDALSASAAQRGLANIRTVQADLVDATLGTGIAQASWCRWVLSFVTAPQRVVARIGAALRPGGVAIFHEYIDYRAWRLAPRSPALESFVQEVMASWRDAGGEPDIGLSLPGYLADSGLRIESLRTHSEIIGPGDFLWQWPATFLEVGVAHLADLGRITPEHAAGVRGAMAAAGANPHALMVTPTVVEIIARRNA
jgi:SAM-dependent methyltransferase